MMKFPAAALLLCLTACNSKEVSQQTDAAKKLDEQAVASGILFDPSARSLSGQFETHSDLGVDKFCAVARGNGFDIGMLAVFGPDSKCEAQGSAAIDGEAINITLAGEGECKFSATFDGSEIRVPGTLPEGCSSYCTPRSTFSGTSYYLVDQGDKAARNSLGRDIERLCGK
jgi:hypothetical protein